MVKKYYVFCFEEKEFKKVISETDIKTDKSYMMKVSWNSRLGKEMRKEAQKIFKLSNKENK